MNTTEVLNKYTSLDGRWQVVRTRTTDDDDRLFIVELRRMINGRIAHTERLGKTHDLEESSAIYYGAVERFN